MYTDWPASPTPDPAIASDSGFQPWRRDRVGITGLEKPVERVREGVVCKLVSVARPANRDTHLDDIFADVVCPEGHVVSDHSHCPLCSRAGNAVRSCGCLAP
jgi:hypothetical protein